MRWRVYSLRGLPTLNGMLSKFRLVISTVEQAESVLTMNAAEKSFKLPENCRFLIYVTGIGKVRLYLVQM